MKKVYEAAHGVEAHMVADLLRQEGIHGVVQGDYLSGAAGALPATGLVQVIVDEADYDRARRIIDQWNAAQPADAPVRKATPDFSPWPYVAAGVLIGLSISQAWWEAARAQAEPLEIPFCRP